MKESLTTEDAVTEHLHAPVESSGLFGHHLELGDEDVKLCLDFYGDTLAEPQQALEGAPSHSNMAVSSSAFKHDLRIILVASKRQSTRGPEFMLTKRTIDIGT